MTVDEVGTRRFDVALELLREGQSFTFDNVNFWLDGEGKIRVGAYASWVPGNISDERAIADIGRGQRLFAYLEAQSAAFAEIVQNRVPNFLLFYDAGTSTIELASLQDGRTPMGKRS